jgi:hypothetical protein
MKKDISIPDIYALARDMAFLVLLSLIAFVVCSILAHLAP